MLEEISGSVCCSVLQCLAESCNVLQCIALCCSVLQCVVAMSFDRDLESLRGLFCKRSFLILPFLVFRCVFLYFFVFSFLASFANSLFLPCLFLYFDFLFLYCFVFSFLAITTKGSKQKGHVT